MCDEVDCSYENRNREGFRTGQYLISSSVLLFNNQTVSHATEICIVPVYYMCTVYCMSHKCIKLKNKAKGNLTQH